MSDDPIKDLEDFNQQGLNVNPLPPSEVRRLGDRMRRRNAAFAAVGAAAAIAVIVTPLAVFAGGRDHAEPPVDQPFPVGVAIGVTFGITVSPVATAITRRLHRSRPASRGTTNPSGRPHRDPAKAYPLTDGSPGRPRR